MIHRHARSILCGAALTAFCALAAGDAVAQAPRDATRDDVLAAMKRATTFMTDKIAYKGGYVWNYLPDFSRRWGEMEARETMIWIQPPGTATMGHLYLDAYHATGDNFYYQAAEQVAGALIWAQHPSGGWNYVADFAGERSLRGVVRHGRQKRLASRRVPALLGQRDVRRRRHRRVGEVPAAPVCREARSEIPAGARQGHPVRARQPVSDRRVASAVSTCGRAFDARPSRLHLVSDVQRRCRRREHRFPGDVLPDARRDAARSIRSCAA